MINAKLYECLVLIILPLYLLAATTPETEDPLMDLYKKYQVVYTGSKGISLRRFLKNNNEYQNHVKRLKDVNGFKSHNIALKNGDQPEVNKTIYVNNPIESKLPQAFMSFEEFKQALVDRVQKDKDAIKRSNLKAYISKRWIVTTKRIKRKPTRTIKIEDVFKNIKYQNRESGHVGPNFSDLQPMQKALQRARLKRITQIHKRKSRASQKTTPTNSKSTKKINKVVSIKHEIKVFEVQSRGTKNMTKIHSNNKKKDEKTLLKKDTSNFFTSGDIRPVLSDSVKKAIKEHRINRITVSPDTQSRESDTSTNPTKHATNVKITYKQSKKNTDVKITKPSQKDEIKISPIPDYKKHTSAKDADARLDSANAFYLRAKETTLKHVTETAENVTSSDIPSSTSSTSTTTKRTTAKKVDSTVDMEMTTITLPNLASAKSTVTTKLVNITKSTVTLLVESEKVTNVTNNAIHVAGINSNMTDNAIHAIESTTNMIESASNSKEVATNVTKNATNVEEVATNVTESATNAKRIATNVTENAKDATESATTELESMSSETEEEGQDETEASTTTTPRTTTVLTQRTLGRPRVFMGR